MDATSYRRAPAQQRQPQCTSLSILYQADSQNEDEAKQGNDLKNQDKDRKSATLG
jgi:hypothetical protein